MLTPIQKNNVNFTSTPIHDVNLKRIADGANIPAVFTRLSIKNDEDLNAVTQIKNKWPKVHQIITCFCNEFCKPQTYDADYFAIELKNNTPFLSEKIVGLFKSIKIKNGDKERVYLSRIFSKPEHMRDNETRTIKGIGEVLLAETFNLAKKIKATCLDFHSDNDAFYFRTFEKAKIKIEPGENFDPKNHDFHFSEKYFDQYIDYCKKEYSIESLQ